MTTAVERHAEILRELQGLRQLVGETIDLPADNRPSPGAVADMAGWPMPWSPRARLRFHATCLDVELVMGDTLLWRRRLVYR